MLLTEDTGLKNKNIKIAVASGKGGTGKTLISTNLFYVLQQSGLNVKLIDCDAEEPNAMAFFSGNCEKQTDVTQKVPVIDESKCTYCSKCHDYCSYNAIFILPPAKIIKVIEELCHDCGACSVACGFNAISEKDVSVGTVSSYSMSEKTSVIEARMKVGVFSPVNVIKAAIKEAGNDGVIILDSPPGTSCPFIQTVTHADFVILVTEPTPFGLSDLKQSVETLETMDKHYGVIVNRSGMGDSQIYNYLEQKKIPLLAEIPFDKEIALRYSGAELITRTDPEWQPMFTALFDLIIEEYGNSGNKR